MGCDQGTAQSAVTFTGVTDLLNGTWTLDVSVLNPGDNAVTALLDNTGTAPH